MLPLGTQPPCPLVSMKSQEKFLSSQSLSLVICKVGILNLCHHAAIMTIKQGLANVICKTR